METKQTRRDAIKAAREKWETAPAHVKIMAGAYVGPLLLALEAINAELDAVTLDLEVIAHALPLEGGK